MIEKCNDSNTQLFLIYIEDKRRLLNDKNKNLLNEKGYHCVILKIKIRFWNKLQKMFIGDISKLQRATFLRFMKKHTEFGLSEKTQLIILLFSLFSK